MDRSASKRKALAQSQNNFTRDLYKELSRKSGDNLFFSPFSVMVALCMTHAGADGRTEQQMRSVMHLTQDKDDLQNDFHHILTEYQIESADYELHTSNSAYIANGLKVLNEFIDTLRDKFLSSSKTVDFSAGEIVRQEINLVVEKETRSHIKDMIPPGLLNSLTAMVLVNAVYFKGFWRHPFDETLTYEDTFWLSENESTKVPMMHLLNYFRTLKSKELGASMLALDYMGSRLSMVIILPDKRGGLSEMEAKISTMNLVKLHQMIHAAEENKVNVILPKFKLEESMSLVKHLREMGMPDLFGNECDLSGITGSSDLCVTEVLHKAFLEVNEKGSEAAAATVVVMTRSVNSRPPTFEADHPFLLFIQDNVTGMILFCGRLSKPQGIIGSSKSAGVEGASKPADKEEKKSEKGKQTFKSKLNKFLKKSTR